MKQKKGFIGKTDPQSVLIDLNLAFFVEIFSFLFFNTCELS